MLVRNWFPVALLAAAVGFVTAQPASAGCGCDHPPPAFAAVMPPFASPGKTIRIHPIGYEVVAGAPYTVDFGSGSAVVAVGSDGYIDVKVPDYAKPGPIGLRVKGSDVDYEYDASYFTALSPAPLVPDTQGTFVVGEFEMSVTTDGTLLIPFNLSQVLDGTQFSFLIGGLRLDFQQDDIVFYNEDNVDLTLFTLDVDDSTQREWGSYYGWTVEDDTGLPSRVWGRKIRRTLMSAFFSDTLTYWRHEFHTYKNAHAPGGTHEVDADGNHANFGTMHIDHDHLVLAINGVERDLWHPDDESMADPLEPGSRTASLIVTTKKSDNPVEPDVMETLGWNAVHSGTTTAMSLEAPSAYDDDDDD